MTVPKKQQWRGEKKLLLATVRLLELLLGLETNVKFKANC